MNRTMHLKHRSDIKKLPDFFETMLPASLYAKSLRFMHRLFLLGMAYGIHSKTMTIFGNSMTLTIH
ncbi:hypothetical protein [Paenibacillus chitinolyticus]|uniref:hypothetical protein n=1 Tax=Paenibacillus chitinolyticus TaxID=79263 RepID=UPI003D06A855